VEGDRPQPTAASGRIRGAAAAAVTRWRGTDGFEGALLYGSAGWGDAGDGSDADVMLLYDRPDVWSEVRRLRDPVSDLSFDVESASWSALARGVAGGWWLPRLVGGRVLLDPTGRLAALRRTAWREWDAAESRAARVEAALPRLPGGDTGPGSADAWRQAVCAAAQGVLLACGVPPSGHHLISRLSDAAGPEAVTALVSGATLPRTEAAAGAMHTATMTLHRWACDVAASREPGAATASQRQRILFALTQEAAATAEREASVWRAGAAWEQWGLACRDLVRIWVLRNVAPLVGVEPVPGALAAWLGRSQPSLVPVLWAALGLSPGTEPDVTEAQAAYGRLARLARERAGRA